MIRHDMGRDMTHFTLAGFHEDSKELTTSATDFKGRD